MKALPIILWVSLLLFTALYVYKFIKLKKRVDFIVQRGATLTEEDVAYFNGLANTAAIVAAIFVVTSIAVA